eukprot:3634218-Alexandrium_andersonii.AAC.1
MPDRLLPPDPGDILRALFCAGARVRAVRPRSGVRDSGPLNPSPLRLKAKAQSIMDRLPGCRMS